MNTTHTIEKNRSHVKADAATEISKVSICAIGIPAGLIGCWATACFVGGLISSGGPIGLMTDYLKAVIG
jgi:hypothetical protein